MFDLHNIFQVPVYQSRYHDAFILENKIVPKLKDLENRNKNNSSPYYPANSYTSFGTAEILDIPELEQLKKFIFDTVNEVHKSAGLGGDLEFTNSWFSINRLNSYHESHTHIPDVWSGVYYVSATPADAAIAFVNRNLKDTMWPFKAPKTRHTSVNSSQVTCSVETGLLIIFPSYLEHKVNQQMVDSERITIAFNLNVKL